MTDGRTVLSPLLAYPVAAIDPGLDHERDEGEARLRLLRPLLRAAKLDDVDAPGALVPRLVKDEQQRFDAHIALFKADAPWKPRVCLHYATTMTLPAETADRMSERERVKCIPVKGTDSVAVLDWPQGVGLPEPKLILDFKARHVGGSGAHIQLKRTAEDAAKMVVLPHDQQRFDVAIRAPAVMLERLFGPLPVDPTATPLPQLAGELPVDVASWVADFWQRTLRCHVVATACAPADATRPLAFESIRARREGSGHDRAVVRAKVHGSSIKCACALHRLTPVQERFPAERFGESGVDFTLSMCGRPLNGSGRCALHGSSTPRVDLLPTVCCHGTVASIGCTHRTRDGKRFKHGLYIPDMGLDDLDLLQAQVLVWGAMRLANKTEPLIGKRPRDELAAACDRAAGEMLQRLDEVARLRASSDKRYSDNQLLGLDMNAVDMLRANTVRRHIRPSTKEEVLAQEQPDGHVAPLSGPQAILSETHLGLFRPAPRKRGRA